MRARTCAWPELMHRGSALPKSAYREGRGECKASSHRCTQPCRREM